jgi:hypothetical protein
MREMNSVGIRNLGLGIFLSLTVASVQPLLHAAQPAQAGAVNLSKEVMDKKNVIVWHDAPAEAIPSDVCGILQVCTGKTKLIALPAATEEGIKVVRGLFLTQDSKHADVVVLARQTPSDRYFYLLSADGKLQKAAFVQLGSKQWSPIAASLAGPQFDKETKVWHDRVMKLGAAPAAAPAQGN